MASHLRALRAPTLAIYLLLLGFFLVVFLQVFGGKTQAANVQRMNFQGKVTNADGTNVTNGNYDFDFILYDDPTAGINRWQEGWTIGTSQLSVTNGIFQVQLGTYTALPNFNTYPNLYLSIRFNNDAAGYMTPRVRLTSVPYALNSDTIGGLSTSNFVQLAQGLQSDSSTTQASIAVNKTNASGTPNILQLQKSGVDVLVVDNTGLFVLGTSSTASAIKFAGSGNVAGTVRKTMPVTGIVAANDVVVIDTVTGGNVTTTTTASDAKVYGVATSASTPQEIVISGTFQVGLLATNQAITPGDFLVTATTAGKVDKSASPPAGSVLGRALESKTASAGGTIWVYLTPGIGGGGGSGATSLDDAYNQAAATGNTILLTAAGGGASIQDAASTVGGNLFAVQKNTGSVTYFGVTTTGVNIQSNFTGTAVNALAFDTSVATPHLKVFASNGTAYVDIYYDLANSQAVFAASTGTTRIGNGSGNLAFRMTAPAHVETHTHDDTGTATAANYTSTDFNFTRNFTGTTFALQGNIFKVEDLSSFTTGSSSPNVLYVNQNNVSATGNLILAQAGGGSNDKFKVNTAGSITIASGANITVGAAAGSSLTCAGGQFLQNQVVTGGVTTGGTCAAAGGDLQTAYNVDAAGEADIVTTSATKTILFKAGSTFDAASLFHVQNAAGSDLFVVDSTNSVVRIGSATADATGILLVLDTKNTAGDPTGANGGMYYNSSTNKFRCYENSAWKDCIDGGFTRIAGSSGTAGPDITLQRLTVNSSDVTTTALSSAVMSTTAVGAGTWKFKYTLAYQTAATGTGIGFGINHTGASTSVLQAMWRHVTTGGAAATGVGDNNTTVVAGQIIEGKSAAILNQVVGAASAGVAVANSNVIAVFEGIIVVTNTGTLELKIASEVAGSAVRIMSNSLLELTAY